MLNKHEQIIWEGRPNTPRVLLNMVILCTSMYTPVYLVLRSLSLVEVRECYVNDILVATSRCANIWNWIHYAILAGITLIGGLYFLKYYGMRYIITTQRVIARSYIAGRGFVNTYFQDINLAETSTQVGPLGKLMGTGLVFIADNDIARSRCIFMFISNPVEVYNILVKEVSSFQRNLNDIGKD